MFRRFSEQVFCNAAVFFRVLYTNGLGYLSLSFTACVLHTGNTNLQAHPVTVSNTCFEPVEISSLWYLHAIKYNSGFTDARHLKTGKPTAWITQTRKEHKLNPAIKKGFKREFSNTNQPMQWIDKKKKRKKQQTQC